MVLASVSDLHTLKLERLSAVDPVFTPGEKSNFSVLDVTFNDGIS